MTAMSTTLPQMFHLVQLYPASRQLHVETILREGFDRNSLASQLKPGMRIAVGVGSRGITNLAEIVRSVLELLRASGAEPFIIPAMGSHGGATPHGQQNVLAGLGITLESTHVPLDTSMDVAEIGTFADDYPLVFSRAALKADAVVVINRIKPHTDFFGNLGSGIQKMLVIGFGKHIGASNAHRAAIVHGHEVVIREAAKVILGKVPVLFAVAILEDQHHQTHDLHVIRGDQILREEDALFVRSQQLLPRLPFPNIDLLIVDEIGKENLLRQIEVAIANGKTMAQACKEAEIVEQTYFRLAQGIRRVTDRPGEAVEGVGAGECEAETPCRRSEPGQAGVEGHRVGKDIASGNSSRKPRTWLIRPVRWLMYRSRTRCKACRALCSVSVRPDQVG
jgi:hypothetical protein